MKTQRITITLSARAVALLRKLTRSGLYRPTVTETAAEMVNQRLREIVKK